MPLNTRILLISPPAPFLDEPAFVPHLGLLCISAALKAVKWDDCIVPHLKYLELAHLEEDESKAKLLSTIDEWNPGIIGFTSTTPQFHIACDLAEVVKNRFPNIKTIVGGAHVTNYSDDVIHKKLFDHVFIGDSEDEIVKFWSHYTTKSTTPVYKNNIGIDVDNVGMPDWSIEGLNLDQYSCTLNGRKALPILTSRGCNYSCAFCEKQPKGYRRERSGTNIKLELRYFQELGINAVVIYDCCLTTNRSRALQFKKIFSDVNSNQPNQFVWRGFLRSDRASDEILDILKQAGCVELGFGIESGSDKILRTIRKNPCTRNTNTNAIRVCRRVGIRSKAFLMVGLPGETRGTVNETISWVFEAEPDQIDVSLYMPYKGSDISDHPEQYDIVFHIEERETDQMFYKGSEQVDYKSFVSIPRKGIKKGLNQNQVLEQYKRLRNFKKKYNTLLTAHDKSTDKGYYEAEENIETYKIISNLVIHEGELIWRQLTLFISTNSLLVLALSWLIRLANPKPLVLLVSGLGILSCIVWNRIYQRSWYNQKIWFYLARKQEVQFRFSHIFSDGALIRKGSEVNDFMERNWKMNLLDRFSITYWMFAWGFGFLFFWVCIFWIACRAPELLKVVQDSYN